MPADPRVSLGARLERKAFRAYLKRQAGIAPNASAGMTAHRFLLWLLKRQQRYDKKPGGLGK